MNTKTDKRNHTKLLYPELSYKIQGALMDVAKKYGIGLKEIIYTNDRKPFLKVTS